MGYWEDDDAVNRVLQQLVPGQSTGAHDELPATRDIGDLTVNELVRRWRDIPSHRRKPLVLGGKVVKETLRQKLTRELTELETAIVALATQRAHREAQLEKLKIFPNEDPFTDGTILMFEKNFPSNPDAKYTFSAVRAGGLWHVTGNRSPNEATWEHLVNWMGLGVDEVWKVDQNGRTKVIG